MSQVSFELLSLIHRDANLCNETITDQRKHFSGNLCKKKKEYGSNNISITFI